MNQTSFSFRKEWYSRASITCIREEEIKYFVSLWQTINNMQELNNLEDTISWRWMVDGHYSASSAYKIQFSPNFCIMKICPIWKAKTEQKRRFFACTILHNRVLTADNHQKNGMTLQSILLSLQFDIRNDNSLMQGLSLQRRCVGQNLVMGQPFIPKRSLWFRVFVWLVEECKKPLQPTLDENLRQPSDLFLVELMIRTKQ